ncbi:MAG TPA: hypothetical protein VGB84_05305 [Arachidicoccus sp.]
MSFESVWTYEKLWLKAKLYMQKALMEDRDGDSFPFWAALSLEFIARSILARVHPVLLADPREGENILYAFGYQKRPSFTPISVPTKTVLERLEFIVPNFTQNEKDFCKEIATRRNSKLHSGSLGFMDYPTRKWLSKFYRIVKLMLEFQGKTLADLLGNDEAIAAEEMIKERDTSLEKNIRDRISEYRKKYESLPEEIKKERIINLDRLKWTIRGNYKKDETCPACGNIGVMTGKLISISDGKAGESEIIQHTNVLPTEFKCLSCDLELTNHMELDAIELGGQYKIEQTFDPKEYYDIPSEEDFDYGND